MPLRSIVVVSSINVATQCLHAHYVVHFARNQPAGAVLLTCWSLGGCVFSWACRGPCAVHADHRPCVGLVYHVNNVDCFLVPYNTCGKVAVVGGP